MGEEGVVVSYSETPPPNPVAVKRMGQYVIVTQVTLRDQPDMLMLDDEAASKLVKQLQELLDANKSSG
jgi:hypothetical protein